MNHEIQRNGPQLRREQKFPPYMSRAGFWSTILLLPCVIALLLWWNWFSTPPSSLDAVGRLLDQPERALKLVQSRIRATDGNDCDAQLLECQLLLALNRGREAELSFQKIQSTDRCDPSRLYEVGARASAMHRLKLAQQALFAAGDFIYREPQRMKLLIYVLYSSRDRAYENRVLELCSDYARRVPDDAFPWLINSNLYRELNNSQLAFDAYREAIRRSLPPDETERVRMQLIELGLIMGELGAARANFDALMQAPRSPSWSGQLMDLQTQLLYHEGKLEELTALLDSVLQREPQLRAARALRGKCRFERGEFPGAIEDLKMVVQQNDFDQRSHYLLGQAYLARKEPELAMPHLNRSRELVDIRSRIMTLENQFRNEPQNRALRRQIADLYVQIGDVEKAAAWGRSDGESGSR